MAARQRSTTSRASHGSRQSKGAFASTAAAESVSVNGDAAFGRYLSELQGVPLLDATGEVELAREIERLVIAHWRALLSYAPARTTVFSAVAATPSACAPLVALARAQLRAKALEPSKVASRLRQLDRDCEALMAADAAVTQACSELAPARRYLERVEHARNAQLAAKNRFVAANLRLVIALARRYDRTLMSLPDLIQEGNLGLMRAVDRFDYRRGFRFSTYAAWWIRHALNRALSNKGRIVRLPVHAIDDVMRIKRALAAAQNAHGGPPSDRELAVLAGMSEEKLSLLSPHARATEPLSLDKHLGADGDQTLHDLLPAERSGDPDEGIDLQRWASELDGLLKGLSAIEAATIRLRFGLGGVDELSLREIGGKYNLSRERIRQIQEQALDKLRQAMRRKRRPHDAESLAA